MLNDTFFNPTKVFFGAGAEDALGVEVLLHTDHVLLHYGRESISQNGIKDKITKVLDQAGVKYTELGGVKENPDAGLVRKGIHICRTNNISFILAVGGGSVIDSAKAISIGTPNYDVDFIDFFKGLSLPTKALKIGTVLTVSGSGSEANCASVISFKEDNLKLSFANPLIYPEFAILNPAFTFSVPAHQTAYGALDALSHVMERYFTNIEDVDCSDRIGEGLAKTLIKNMKLAVQHPECYAYRAELMWASKLANDNTSGFGRKADFSSHRIAHEVSAEFDTIHAATVNIIMLGWMKFVFRHNPAPFIRFAKRVYGVDIDHLTEELAVQELIVTHKKLLKEMNLATSLQELGIQNGDQFDKIAKRAVAPMKSGTIGHFQRLAPKDIIEILKLSFDGSYALNS